MLLVLEHRDNILAVCDIFFSEDGYRSFGKSILYITFFLASICFIFNVFLPSPFLTGSYRKIMALKKELI